MLGYLISRQMGVDGFFQEVRSLGFSKGCISHYMNLLGVFSCSYYNLLARHTSNTC